MSVEDVTWRILFWALLLSLSIPGMEQHRHFQNYEVKLLKTHDKEIGISWTWPQSINSVSIKSPLGGR